MQLKFGYTVVYVQNVSSILDFYGRAFGFATKFIYENEGSEPDYGELDTGNTVIGFASHQLGNTNLPDGYQPANPNDKPLGMELVFVADDVESAFNHAISEGAIALQPPVMKPWGQTVAYLQDPEGILIELCSPMN